MLYYNKMELTEVHYKNISVSSICNNILKINNALSIDNMLKLFPDFKSEDKIKFSISVTRLVMDCTFLPLLDDIIPQSPFLVQRIMGTCEFLIQNGQKIYIYQDEKGLPSSTILRTTQIPKLLHATLNLTASKEDENPRIKKLYYNKSFFLGEGTSPPPPGPIPFINYLFYLFYISSSSDDSSECSSKE